MKPHPQVDDKKAVAASNGSKRPASVSTGTQTDPVRPAKGAEGAESASWGPPGAQTEWEDADQSGKPGILGARPSDPFPLALAFLFGMRGTDHRAILAVYVVFAFCKP